MYYLTKNFKQKTSVKLLSRDKENNRTRSNNSKLDKDLPPSKKMALATLPVRPAPIAHEPRTYKEAIKFPKASRWAEAAEKEFQSIVANYVFKVVDLPPGKHAISARLLFKRKIESNNKVLKHKARLVGRGFQQQKEPDSNKTYSSVVKPASYRILFALSAILG